MNVEECVVKTSFAGGRRGMSRNGEEERQRGTV